MENKEFPQIDRILDSIRASLKTELDSIKTELKADLKAEMDNLKTELKAEYDGIKTGAPIPPSAPPMRTPNESAFEGDLETREFKLSDFSSVNVGGAFEVEITHAESYSISVTADKGLFKNLNVAKEGDTLTIGHAKHIAWFSRITRPKARITMPLLKGLQLSGASRCKVSGFSSSENLKLSLSGASSIIGDVTAGDTECDLSGASKVELTGSAKDLVINASGANQTELGDFSVHNVAVRLSGANRTTIKMDGRLDARLSGASSLSYLGSPTMGEIRTTGASKISKK